MPESHFNGGFIFGPQSESLHHENRFVFQLFFVYFLLFIYYKFRKIDPTSHGQIKGEKRSQLTCDSSKY